MRYAYDSIDRLTREDNKKLGTTVLFAYDNCGNIISRRQTSFTLKTNVEECEFTKTLYSYDGDKLPSFGTEACEYDAIGNPTTYRGKTVAWAKGRQMTAYDGNTFAYDGQGRRISKNSIAYTYDGSGRLIASSNGLEYLYDQSGVFAVKRGESTYFYRKDAQGNIIVLLNSSGNVVVNMYTMHGGTMRCWMRMVQILPMSIISAFLIRSATAGISTIPRRVFIILKRTITTPIWHRGVC